MKKDSEVLSQDLSLKMALIGLFINIFLASAKLLAGVIGHSFALVADAIESLADILGSFVIWGGLKYGGKEPDEDHPFGHGKAEALAALAVCFLIILAGLGIAVQAIHEIRTPHLSPAPFTLLVLVFVIVTKETLFRISNKAAVTTQSSAGFADAGHHRSDAITSLFAFIGITVALLGGPEWAVADDWAAFLAAPVIVFNGIKLARGPMGELLDENAFDLAVMCKELTLKIDGVKDVEKCEARKTGRSFRVVMHVEVSPSMSVADAHVLTGKIKSKIKEENTNVASVLIHVEPFSGHLPLG